MNFRCVSLLLALGVCEGLSHGLLAADATDSTRLGQQEFNAWPFVVRQSNPKERRVDSWSGAGPFLFHRPQTDEDGGTASGFRPFWVQMHNADGDFRSGYFLYPIFSYTMDENTYRWSVFELVRRWGRRAGADAPASDFALRGEFEIFPIWFSRQTGNPELSYRALFPIHGTIKNKLFFEQLSWTLFPLYVRNEKRGVVTTSTPWPILRVHRGAASGWGVWPLFNVIDRPGISHEAYFLWPLIFNVTRQPHPDDPPGTPVRRDVGALPFWARSTGPGFINEDYAWPFFGYTERTAPERYTERRYFWPFLVQGRGDHDYVNRWGPFYTHSIHNGVDKRWFAWPLVRRAKWTQEGVDRTRTQLLYFLYWNEEQRAAGRTGPAAARLTHLWPLWSHWKNDTGQRQWQFFSPLNVFFPGNETIRHTWSPFFSIARHDQRAPGETRTSFLWDAVTYEKDAAARRSEFHVGPVLSVIREDGAKRIAIGNGLFGFRRPAGGGWRMFWLDFPEKPVSTSLSNEKASARTAPSSGDPAELPLRASRASP